MSRNEVEMDLSKFMEMIQENAVLKDEIRDLKSKRYSEPLGKSGFTLQISRFMENLDSCIFKCLYYISVLCDYVVHGITRTINGTIWIDFNPSWD